jgi:cytochrome c-type biogenesis protein CcmE
MKKKRLLKVVLSAVLVVGAIGYLVVSSFGKTMVYYKTVDELLNDTSKYSGTPIRINGVLVPESLMQKPGTHQYRFQMSKRGKVLDVSYLGIVPDSMEDGRDLIVQGEFNVQAGLFDATEILTKCPSKYEAKAQAIAP